MPVRAASGILRLGLDKELTMAVLPPLLLEPRLDSRVWGGTHLASWLGLAAAPSPLAEVWLVYAENRICGGPLAGMTLAEATTRHGADLVGTVNIARSGAQFPLLAKFLDAADHLSVQVHPDDAYAHSVEAASGFNGKTEAWYILRADPQADVIHGFAAPTSRAGCEAAIDAGGLIDLLRRVPAQAGETIFVPAGTIHAINAGVMLFEIQQTSDLTYRVYDYGRPRELHLERALEVLNYDLSAPAVVAEQPLDASRTRLIACEYFTMERWGLSGPVSASTDLATFEILTVIEGAATLRTAHGSLDLACGTAVVLPASLGGYTLEPRPASTILRCTAP
jgi:mannose-6-phosphate isomerase